MMIRIKTNGHIPSFSTETGEKLTVLTADVRFRPDEIVTADVELFVGEFDVNAQTRDVTALLPDGKRYRLVPIE
jgi:hypothetical protein